MPILQMHRECGCALFLLWVVAAFDLGEAADIQEDRMVACEPKTCGSGPRVSFPFWIDGQHPSYCGLPAFKLNCEDGSSMLPISGDDYTVQNIFYDRSTIELIKRVPEATDNCSSFPYRNLTLERTPFTVSSTSNTSLFFFYHCNRSLLHPPPEVPLTGLVPLPCDQQDVAFPSFVGYSLSLPQLNKALLRRACSTLVNLSIDPFDQSLGANTTYRQLLDFHIALSWPGSECSKCENSGGRCGTNFTENNNFNFICICKDRDHRVSCVGRQTKQNKWKWKIIGSTVGGAGFVVALLFFFICGLRLSMVRKRRAYLPNLTRIFMKKLNESPSVEVFLEEYKSLALKRYKYSELMKITKSFHEILGQGGYGKVFKGKLEDGRVVAVKLLNESKASGQEFINEVASIGRTNHVNIVQLLGYSSKGSKQALVYEFMPNGSLERFLSNGNLDETMPL